MQYNARFIVVNVQLNMEGQHKLSRHKGTVRLNSVRDLQDYSGEITILYMIEDHRVRNWPERRRCIDTTSDDTAKSAPP